MNEIEQSAAELLIDDLAHFRHFQGREGQIPGRLSEMRGQNFTKLGEDIEPSSTLTKFVSDFRYLVPFRNAGASSVVENFLTPIKLGEGERVA